MADSENKNSSNRIVMKSRERSSIAVERASSILRSSSIRPLTDLGRQLTIEIDTESKRNSTDEGCKPAAQGQLDDDVAEEDNLYDTDIEMDEKAKSPVDTYGKSTYQKTCRKLGETPITCVQKALITTDVVIKNRGLSSQSVLALCNALLANTTITYLNLDGNGIDKKGAQYVSWMLAENTRIRILSLNENCMGSDGLGHLTKTLTSNETVYKLSLSGNNFHDKDAECIAEILTKNKTLKELDLSYNNFGDKAADILGPAIGANDVLRVLNLSWNKFMAFGAVSIARGLAENVGLKSLVLEMNGLADRGASAMAEALKLNDSLIDLDISNNRIHDDGASRLAKMLEANESLRILKIGNNPLTTVASVVILECVLRNPNSALVTLDMTGIPVFKESTLSADEIKEVKPHFTFKYTGVVTGSNELDGAEQNKFFANKNPMTILKWYISYKSLRLVDIFKQFDQDGDCKISREEFVTGIQAMRIPMNQAQLNTLVEQMDENGDGQVDMGELVKADKTWRKSQQRKTKTIQKRQSVLPPLTNS